MSDQPVRRAMSMLLVTVGCLWIALTGGCTFYFFGLAGLAFIKDHAASTTHRYFAGYDLVVLLGSIPVGAIGVGVGLMVLWAGLSGKADKHGVPWIGRALIIIGAPWTVMGGLAMAGMGATMSRSGELHDMSLVWVWLVTTLMVLGPGVLMLSGGAMKLCQGGKR